MRSGVRNHQRHCQWRREKWNCGSHLFFVYNWHKESPTIEQTCVFSPRIETTIVSTSCVWWWWWMDRWKWETEGVEYMYNAATVRTLCEATITTALFPTINDKEDECGCTKVIWSRTANTTEIFFLNLFFDTSINRNKNGIYSYVILVCVSNYNVTSIELSSQLSWSYANVTSKKIIDYHNR